MHGFGAAEEALGIDSASTASECFMKLLEYDRHEKLSSLLTLIGGARTMRQAVDEEISDKDMQETESEKYWRYQKSEQCEVSDLDLCANVHYGVHGSVEKETPDNGLMES